jgi:hypothetical protein
VTVPHYTCPCCGYIVFTEPPGSYDICLICFWEDDALQLEFALTLAGGANADTLISAQLYYLAHAAHFPDLVPLVRWPGAGDRRDPLWRPIDTAVDSFPDWNAPRGPRPPHSSPEALYYWHPAFWRRRTAP